MNKRMTRVNCVGMLDWVGEGGCLGFFFGGGGG